jgi:DNA-binding CsgD family transcriptional regulator
VNANVDYTAREQQMLALLCDGHSLKQIAAVMGVSPQRAGQIQQQLIAKTEARSVVQLCLVWHEARKAGAFKKQDLVD